MQAFGLVQQAIGPPLDPADHGAEDSLRNQSLPIGLAHGAKLKREVSEKEMVSCDGLEVADTQIIRVRREMEDAPPIWASRPDYGGRNRARSIVLGETMHSFIATHQAKPGRGAAAGPS